MDIPPEHFVHSFLKAAHERGIRAGVFYSPPPAIVTPGDAPPPPSAFKLTTNLGKEGTELLLAWLRTGWMDDPRAIEAACKALRVYALGIGGVSKRTESSHFAQMVVAVLAAIRGDSTGYPQDNPQEGRPQ